MRVREKKMMKNNKRPKGKKTGWHYKKYKKEQHWPKSLLWIKVHLSRKKGRKHQLDVANDAWLHGCVQTEKKERKNNPQDDETLKNTERRKKDHKNDGEAKWDFAFFLLLCVLFVHLKLSPKEWEKDLTSLVVFACDTKSSTGKKGNRTKTLAFLFLLLPTRGIGWVKASENVHNEHKREKEKKTS